MRWTLAGLLAVGALGCGTAAAGLAPTSGRRANRLARVAAGDTAPGEGLIAFRDSRGIGTLDPRDGRQRLLLAVPAGCTSSKQAGPPPPIELAGPVWASSRSQPAELYFWLTDWQYRPTRSCSLPKAPSSLLGTPLLVEANPVTGSLRLAAVPPHGVPCEPGTDLAALPAALAFTTGGCDETSVELAALPLERGARPATAKTAIPPARFCGSCAIDQLLLGPGPRGRVLLLEVGTQSAAAPAPSLQWFDQASGAARVLSPAPPLKTSRLETAAASPDGSRIAFAAGTQGAGVLDLKTGAWSATPLPACRSGCNGVVAVSWSPDGLQLAVASGGELVVDRASGGGSPRVLLRGLGVRAVSWSDSPNATTGGAGSSSTSLAAVLRSFSVALARAGGSSPTGWTVLPAAHSAPSRASLPVPGIGIASLPGRPSALLVLSSTVALAAGRHGAMWRSTDGGRSWKTVSAHCAQAQMVTRNSPCDIRQLASLPGRIALAGGPAGLWRSADAGASWQRDPIPGTVAGGPWATGPTTLVLAAPTGASAPKSLNLLVSRDHGRSWRALTTVPKLDPDAGARSASFTQFFPLRAGVWAELYRIGDCSLPADLRLTTDGGRRWRSLPVDPLLQPQALAAAGTDRILLASSFCASGAPRYGQGIFAHGLATSGAWSTVRLPPGYLELGAGGAASFPHSSPVTTFSLASLAFASAKVGIAVGAQAAATTNPKGNPDRPPSPTGTDLILITHNGGTSWTNASTAHLPGLDLLSCTDTRCLAASTTTDKLVVYTPAPR